MNDLFSKELLVTQISEPHKSKFGGEFQYIFFKDPETGQNYKTCISDSCRNKSHWHIVLDSYSSDKELKVTHLRLKSGNLIDADSSPELV